MNTTVSSVSPEQVKNLNTPAPADHEKTGQSSPGPSKEKAPDEPAKHAYYVFVLDEHLDEPFHMAVLSTDWDSVWGDAIAECKRINPFEDPEYWDGYRMLAAWDSAALTRMLDEVKRLGAENVLNQKPGAQTPVR